MDETASTQIAFLSADLLSLHFEITGTEMPKPLPIGLSFEYDHDIDKPPRMLRAVLSGNLFGGLPEDKRPPVEFTFAVAGVFRSTGDGGMPLEEFAEVHAPAHLVPFVRELIANITTRSPLPTVRIGPINVVASVRKGGTGVITTQRKKPAQADSGQAPDDSN